MIFFFIVFLLLFFVRFFLFGLHLTHIKKMTKNCIKDDYSVNEYVSSQTEYFVTIDLFRGACAVKGNVPVAGYVKRVDHRDAFNA